MDFPNYFIKLILIFIQINLSLNTCDDRAKPIFVKSSNSCEMKYCQKEEFEKEICIKDNEIIKVQWLSNIIKLTQIKYRNPKIAKYENGNIGILTGEKFMMLGVIFSNFYFLNENGRFSNIGLRNIVSSSQSTIGGGIRPSVVLKPGEGTSGNFDNGDTLFFKTSDNKEFVLNIGKQFENTELSNLQEKILYSNATLYVFDNKIFVNIRGSLFVLKGTDYILYAGLCVAYQSSWNYVLPSSYTKELALFKIDMNSIQNFRGSTINTLVSTKFNFNIKL